MSSKMLRPNVGIYIATADAFGGADVTSSSFAPTLAQLTDPTKVFNISPALTDNYTLNMSDSDTNSSLSVVDTANSSMPTAYNYEASFDGFVDAGSGTSFYNKFKTLATAAAGTKYYLLKRIGKTHDAAMATGDVVSVYGVTLDYPVDMVADGEPIKLGARFLQTGEVATNVSVATGTAGAGFWPTSATATGTKIQSNGNIAVYWIPASSVTSDTSFAAAPSAAIITAGVNLSSAIAWDGYTLGSTESNKIDDKGIVDKANAKSRGFSNYEGSLTFFRGVASETTGAYYDAFETFKGATDARSTGWLAVRIGKTASDAIVATDVVSVYKFTADSIMDNTEGEDSIEFMVKFIPQGVLGVKVAAVA